MSETALPELVVRLATLADLEGLLVLETAEFAEDRLGRRSLRQLLRRPTAFTLAAVAKGSIVGYAMVLLRKGSSIARLFSLVRSSELSKRGVGGALLIAAEQEAAARGAVEMRLEVREDNGTARRLYERHDFTVFARTADYYEDHADALRMRKPLSGAGR